MSHMVPPQSIPSRQTGNHCDAGIVAIFLVVGAFYTLSLPVWFNCKNGKIQVIVLLHFFLDCSLAPGMFLIYFFGLYPTFKVSAVFALNAVFRRLSVGCAHSIPVGLIKDFFPCVSPTLPATSALTMENIEVIVGLAGSYAVTAIHFVILPSLVDFSKKGTWEKYDVYVKHTLPLKHNLWVILVIIFAVFAINTFTVLCIKHLM